MCVHAAYAGMQRQGSTKGSTRMAGELRKIVIFAHIFLYGSFLAALKEKPELHKLRSSQYKNPARDFFMQLKHKLIVAMGRCAWHGSGRGESIPSW